MRRHPERGIDRTAHPLGTPAGWPIAQVGGRPAKRVEIKGPDVRLDPKPTLAFSVAMHEPATSAIKYGALSNETGRVEIRWSRAEDRLELAWTESVGPQVRTPERAGFRSRLMKRLARGLEAPCSRIIGPSATGRPAGVISRLRPPSAWPANGPVARPWLFHLVP